MGKKISVKDAAVLIEMESFFFFIAFLHLFRLEVASEYPQPLWKRSEKMKLRFSQNSF